MKQGVRFLFKPSVFFGQLQWSSHHWFILVAFLGIAALETHIGHYEGLYSTLASHLEAQYGLSLDQSIWVITFAKLFLMTFGAWLITEILWIVGNQIGTKNSKRVLSRRMAIVFTVLLAGYTADHVSTYPSVFFLTLLLYFWGALLGYYAIREQFALNNLATWVVASFAFLLLSSAWHFSGHALEMFAGIEVTHTQGVSKPVVVPRPVVKAPNKAQF